jgi:hypothetical protein
LVHVIANDENLDDLFEGVMIPVHDWDVGDYEVPGWQCKTFQSNQADVTNLLQVLDAQGCPVFFKGNLKWAAWREEFPKLPETVKPGEQLGLF